MIANLSRTRIIFFTLISCVVLGLIGAVSAWIYIYYQESKYEQNKIYPNVYIDNIDIGGKTKAETEALFERKYDPKRNISISILYKNENIATLSAETLSIKSNANEIVDRAYLIGRTPDKAAKFNQIVSTILGFQKYHFSTHLVYDTSDVNDYIQSVEESYNRPARNALFEFENGTVKTFKPDEKGIKINSEKFKNDVEKAVQELNIEWENKQIILTDTVIEPAITLAKANDFGIEELIGEGRSNFSHSIPSRVHNVIQAASKFHGVLVPKDSVFSFNQIIGDISAATGYLPAYVISGGKTILGDGGGVCQVSTTAFRAAMNTGLPIIERNAHAYRVGYYENDSQPGFDATIFYPTVDFKFKNDTPASILIQTEVDRENNLLYFRFYGKRDNRRVEISPVTIWDVTAPPAEIRQDDPNLKKGVVQQVDFPAWGSKTKFTYKVMKDNQIYYQKEFLSIYRPWQAVYLVGTAD